MEGSLTVVCIVCGRKMIYDPQTELWQCDRCPLPTPTLYDWKQETDNG